MYINIMRYSEKIFYFSIYMYFIDEKSPSFFLCSIKKSVDRSLVHCQSF